MGLTRLRLLTIFTHIMSENDFTISTIRNFPVELHRDFKAMCSKLGLTLNEKVLDLIQEYVSKNKSKVLK